MKQTRTIFLFVFFTITAVYAAAQTKIIDGLKQNIRAAQSNAEKVKAIFTFCELGYTLHPDTLMLYAEKAKAITIEEKNLHDELQATYYECGALTTKGYIDSSLSLLNKCLATLTTKVNDAILEANCYNQKGRCYVRKNQYKEAIDMGYQTFSLAEKNNDVLLQVKGKTLIGWAYLEMGQLKDALSWHLKALHTTTDTLLLEKYAILFANLATNYNGLGKTDSAFYYIDKGITYSRRHENLFALSNSLAIQSELYVKSGQAKLSEPILKEVVEIRKTIGDPFYIASDMSQLGFYYAHYGQPEKGIAICEEGIAIAKKYKLDTKLFFLYGSLADNYKAMGNMNKYAEVLQTIISLKDSVYQKNSALSLAEMQTKYETEKNNNIIAGQKLALIEKNYWLYGLLAIAVLSIIVFYALFTVYRKKQILKNEMLMKEEKYHSTLAVAAAEENERKRIATDLHDNIGAYASAICADVEKIAGNVLSNNTISLQNLQQHSQEIINSLRDTIWVLNKDNITVTGLSDRIKNYISKLQSTYNQTHISLHEKIEKDARLSSKIALNIFRIIQEAVHNALKHSGAGNIDVSISSNSNIMIAVTDDGKGMEQANGSVGNGLINMKTRAKEIDMELTIESAKNQGTVLLLQSNTTKLPGV
ncbi:tetratricopeptide repeat-containing sensor histidine kinase [Ferruginibacter sp. SUN106]|uniref:tetratricopeptide repeat-containing sensor histidine kinase n=1 Tax=Ferruginibacter sp. SUN106 TaxID=2978348 RepID=UPI003D36B226